MVTLSVPEVCTSTSLSSLFTTCFSPHFQMLQWQTSFYLELLGQGLLHICPKCHSRNGLIILHDMQSQNRSWQCCIPQHLLLEGLCKNALQSMSSRRAAVTVLTHALQLKFLSNFCNYYRYCTYFVLKMRKIAVYIMPAHGCFMNSPVVCLSVLADKPCDSTPGFLLSNAMKRLINLHTI